MKHTQMSRDYKARSNVPRRKTRSLGNTLIGVFIGLVMGVLIAFSVVWYLNETPVPFLNGANPSQRAADSPPGAGPDAAIAPLVLPGKPGDKPPVAADKPRFEFYKILPGEGEASPGPVPAVVSKPESRTGAELLYLQAGAFQSPADADNLRAKLALMGFEASVQRVTMDNGGVWHRVRLGPYRNQDEFGPVRNHLLENGIQVAVVKTKEGAAH